MRARTAFGAVLLGSIAAAPLAARTVQEPPPIEAGRAAPEGRYGTLDVVHYEITIGLPGPGGTEIEGDATLTLRPARTGLDEAVLDFTGLAVSGTWLDGAEVASELRDGRLHVPLPPGTGPSDTVRLRVVYRGTPDDGLILGDNVHGRPSAFVDNWPNRTRFWLPSVDHPSDKATASFRILAPEGWEVVANGVQGTGGDPAEPATDGTPRQAWRWRNDVPVSAYNLVFGAADMVVKPVGLAACGKAPASLRADGCVEVSTWLFEEDEAQSRLSFRRAAEMVDFYTDLVGPYPFQKLAHVQSATRFGGMENASAIFYSERALASGRDMEGTVAHETAHQWFGDSVTEADWPELWLSEGFATYFGHLFFQEKEGDADFYRRLALDRERVLASDDVRRPVIDREEEDLFALLNANNYPKGGWVLHMLRSLVGDDTFFEGIRSYYARHAGGTATTADLQAAMEEVAGRDLGWFFHQWLEEPGYPVLDLSAAWDADTHETVVTVRQVQQDDWPTFRLPLHFVLSDGVSIPSRGRGEMVGREQTFRIPTDGPRLDVSLDPRWTLFQVAG